MPRSTYAVCVHWKLNADPDRNRVFGSVPHYGIKTIVAAAKLVPAARRAFAKDKSITVQEVLVCTFHGFTGGGNARVTPLKSNNLNYLNNGTNF